MKVSIEAEIKPFTVPNFVIVRGFPRSNPDGYKVEEDKTEGIPLSALDSFTLDKLCEDFKNEVFRKAGKEHLPQARCEHCG